MSWPHTQVGSIIGLMNPAQTMAPHTTARRELITAWSSLIFKKLSPIAVWVSFILMVVSHSLVRSNFVLAKGSFSLVKSYFVLGRESFNLLRSSCSAVMSIFVLPMASFNLAGSSFVLARPSFNLVRSSFALAMVSFQGMVDQLWRGRGFYWISRGTKEDGGLCEVENYLKECTFPLTLTLPARGEVGFEPAGEV